MWARGHFVGAIGSLHKHTMSPTRRLCDGTGHLDSFRKLVRYFMDHHCQKCRTSAWHKRQHHNTDIEVAGDSVSGKASRGAAMRKCPEVRAPIRSSGCGRGNRGLEFRHACICARTVVSSSKLRRTPPTIVGNDA